MQILCKAVPCITDTLDADPIFCRLDKTEYLNINLVPCQDKL